MTIPSSDTSNPSTPPSTPTTPTPPTPPHLNPTSSPFSNTNYPPSAQRLSPHPQNPPSKSTNSPSLFASMNAAYDVAARLHAQNQDLHTALRMEVEKSRMSERVIQDYADLVRKLEGRRSSIPTISNIPQNDEQLEKTRLQNQLSDYQYEVSVLQTRLEAQTQTNSDLISQVSQLQVDIDKHDRDDDTASKMVSRYMKFSQQSTNALQTTLTSLQHRHTTTLTSYTSQIHLLHHQIQTLTSLSDHLRYHLSKEHFGRRWETRMRLHLVRREERCVEGLKRWLRRSEERGEAGMMEMIQDAKIIIDQLDAPLHIDDHHQPISGSLARIVMMQSTIQDLLDRLKDEQERRLELEEWVGSQGFRNDQVENGVTLQDQDGVVLPLEPIIDLYGERIYPILEESRVKEVDTASPPSITSHDTIVEVMVEQDVEKETDTALDVPPPPPHPLLKSLYESRNRYTHIQNSFHNCHIALEHLKSHLTLPINNNNNNLPYDALRIIVQRLDDYTEDVRVELEIRVLDEDVLGRGYETLLMCSLSPSGGEEGKWNEEEEEEVLDFVNGTDPSIVKAMKGFEDKVRDLEEDVGVMKKVVYRSIDDDDDEEEEQTMKKISTTDDTLSTETLVATPPTSRWMTSWISPIPPPSQHGSSSILRRTVSSLGLSPSSSHKGVIHAKMSTGEVIQHLQLKTPMPELITTHEHSGFVEKEEWDMVSRLGSSVTAVTSRTRSSFAIGMGVVGGDRGPRGKGRGMLGSGMMMGDMGRRRVVSTSVVMNTITGGMEISKKMGVPGEVGEDVD
ncbi:hypothetical protein Agabi119p4_3298 [Agaricus bisporus var. burnettii]|uniref:Uncharacterized protein n=1 Tax=Agaricus bisporus var. burnettii TaxID=192524 RepID=A0A8H7F707_AGABI|nr:hypothetical protein Agabi119p4_3298 [Agaricus bisporus var. burnettii]